MKINNTITVLFAALGFLTGCSDDITGGNSDTNRDAIILRAGISEGGAGVMTRAAYNPEANHGSHVQFTQNTALTLRVDGVWKGKADGSLSHGSISSHNVTQTTTAAIGTVADGTDEKHSNVTFSPAQQLYWDDYGSADPANMSTSDGGNVSDGTDGRGRGLDIFAVAVDGVTTAPEVSSWTALPWALEPNQTSGWNTKDLLTSNNVKKTNVEETNNPYKFNQRSAGKLIEFTHAMTKITVNLTAGEGFPGFETGAANAKFQAAPTVKLLGFNYTGSYNIETKTPTATAATTTDIKMHLAEGGASNNKAKFDALVFPGNQFTATIGASPEYKPTSTANILELNADGNIYKVTAAQLVKAMNAAGTTGSVNGTLAQGKNYILNIIVNKTKIVVTATIKDWIDVEADSETPKINVVANVGDATVDANTKDRMPSFDFYLSDAVGASASTAYDKKATATKPTEGADGATVWTFDNPLYWPNHQTHYLMRGVSPINTTVSAGKITVSNIDYDAAATSMSNLLVGAPVIAANTMCGNGDHTAVDMSTGGICAREGKINLTFNYMMSQLEVRLTTAASTAPEYVNLTNAKVELVNVYTTGEVDIHTKTVATTGSTGDFEVKHVGTENANYRHSAIVPQDLTFTTAGATTNLRFKITIYKNGVVADGIDDIYYADVKPIKVTEPGDTESKLISKWDSGKHYIYTLDLKKTAINVTATLKDWVTVTASDNVWF